MLKSQLKRTDRWIIFLSILILIHLFARPITSGNWFLDLTNHFMPYELTFFSVLVAIFAWRRGWKAGLGSTLALGILFGLDQFPSSVEGNPQHLKIKVISFNVLTKNQRHEEVVRWIQSQLGNEDITLVFLMETNARWTKALEPLKKRLPFSLTAPMENNFGFALFSNVSLEGVIQASFDEFNLPAAYGHLLDRKIRIFGVHPVPPTNERNFAERNFYFKRLRSELDKEKTNTLVFGDFNSTPWSSHMSSLMKEDLQYSMKGIFRSGTWISPIRWISIPIDHIVFTGGLKVLSSSVGPNLGSDHLPVMTILEVPHDESATDPTM